MYDFGFYIIDTMTPHIIYYHTYTILHYVCIKRGSYDFPLNTLWLCRRTLTVSSWPSLLCTRLPPFLATVRSGLRLSQFCTVHRTRVYSCACSLRANVRPPSYEPRRSTNRKQKIAFLND